MSSTSPSKFSVELESLRGIAAFHVVLGHFYLLTHPPLPFISLYQLMGALMDPQPDVLLFFAISGLVLGRQLASSPVDSLSTFFAFVIRRFFRLVPLMWAATIFAFAFAMTLFNSGDFPLLWQHFLLNDIRFLITLWSLKVEIICSFFFPFLYLLHKRGGKNYNRVFLIIFAALSYFCRYPLFLQFMVFFQLGLIVDDIKYNNHHQILKNLLFLGAVITLYFAPEWATHRNWSYGHWKSWVLPELIACPLILYFVLNKTNTWVTAFLQHAFIRYIGKISFSLYLFHFPILVFFSMKVPVTSFSQFLWLGLIEVAAITLLSGLTYKWIELPSNRLGKRIASSFLKPSDNLEVSGVIPS